jgi:hypothetical protein
MREAGWQWVPDDYMVIRREEFNRIQLVSDKEMILRAPPPEDE